MGMASGVRRQSHEAPGYKAFQEHYSTLVVGIQDPAELAGKLFSRKMITDGIRTKVENLMADKLSRCRELLTAVLSEIASDPNSFWTFITVLEQEPTLQVIAESMRKSCKTHEHLHLVQPAHERISLRDHRWWLVIFIGGLLLALLCGHLYTTYEVPSTSPPLNTTHNCTELEKLSIRHASDEIAPNNLPYVRGHFVGRDSELQEISHMLIHSTHSGVAMVNIYGAPAVGKSTLAIKVGHQLVRHGIVVRYVNAYEAQNLFVSRTSETVSEPRSSIHGHTTDTSSHSKDITSYSTGGVLAIPWYSYTEKKYVLTSPQKLMQWAKGLTNDTLLVLDNCDDLLQRNKTQESKFKEILRALLEASNYLRIVVTSRAQMSLVGGFRPYRLKDLDPTSAVHLLQLQSSLISSEEGKVITELVGNNPLGLGIVAGLVNENFSSPHLIIKDLKQRPIVTLSQPTLPESQQLIKVLQLSYSYLHNEIQMCSQYLSHFPGSFHRDAALNILNMCNFSDPNGCMKTLTTRSFLEAFWRAGQPRYQFHKLIREFLQYIQSECRDDHIETEFSLYYQRYYSQSIAILSELYRRNSYSNEITSSLECDTHNFLNILQKMVKLQLDTKSVLNIAYGISNGTNLIHEILDCNNCFAKLLKALMSLLDQNIFEFSQEIGLNTTTLLYFDLISTVKEWLIKPKREDSVFCMPVCMETFVDHHSRVEKLSRADSNTLDAYYYHPLLCYLDCFSSSYHVNNTIILEILFLAVIHFGVTSFYKVCKSLLLMSICAFTIYIATMNYTLKTFLIFLFVFIGEIPVAMFIATVLRYLTDQQLHIKLITVGMLVSTWPNVTVMIFSILPSFNVFYIYLYYSFFIVPFCHSIVYYNFWKYHWAVSAVSLCFLFALLLYSYIIQR